MLEDSLQASLPSFITGVRVADLGQGSEPVRILGVQWLDPGAAARDVDGMKGEEGDFVNMEVSIAYRAKETTGTGLRSRSVNAHILMEFYLAGGVMVPVWVELTGILAVARLRIQLMPNPPFLSMTTLTLLGLPKVSMKCTPLAKNFLNVMDVPFLSNLISSSIDAVTQEYVAPKSITLDLKAMLGGRPKMDTDALGVLVVTLRRAGGFDVAKSNLLNPMGKGRDLYITVGWSKWGKPLWSTRYAVASYHWVGQILRFRRRIIQKEGSPVWEETTALLVGMNELNAREAVMLQVWDSGM
jgi:Ca2+-dependent lipid-binding protein